jgi:hypothetical protein
MTAPAQSAGIRARVAGLAAKLAEKPAQPVEPAVCVAGDAVRPAVASGVVPRALALEDGCLDLLDTVEGVTRWKPSVPQPSHRTAQLRLLTASHGAAEVAAGAVSARASRSRPPGSRRDGQRTSDPRPCIHAPAPSRRVSAPAVTRACRSASRPHITRASAFRCRAQELLAPAEQIGDLISYQNDGKYSTAGSRKVGRS